MLVDKTQSAQEKWLPVVGYEGFYEVSNKGNVRGVDRITGGRIWNGKQFKRIKRGSLLKLAILKTGYPSVVLCKEGKIIRFLVHRIVLIAFIGKPIGRKNWCNHKDSIRSNNNLNNLEWTTPSENNYHAVKYGHRWNY